MAGENSTFSAARRLSSWKEIAAFVGRDERTVKRWEQSRGLPVRRMPGAGRAAVFAYAEEIEIWMRQGVQPGLAAPAQSTGSKASLPRSPRVAVWMLILLVVALAGASAVLLLRRGPAVTRPASDRATTELYRSGLHEWQTRTPSGLSRAIADFQGAVARDPRYAPAYVGLAEAYNLEAEFTALPEGENYRKAIAAATRALAIDPSRAEAHAALAFAEFYGLRDARVADREFRRALVLDPASAVTHHWYATFLMTIGQSDGALAQIRKAEALDSESSAIPADKALILFHAGRTDEAIRLLTQLEADQPDFASPHRYLATIWLSRGDDAGYLRELKSLALARHDGDGLALTAAGLRGMAEGGHNGMLRAMLDVQRRLFLSGRQSAYAVAATLAELGDARSAKSYLAMSVARHETSNIALMVDPPFAALRGDLEVKALMAKAGLTLQPG